MAGLLERSRGPGVKTNSDGYLVHKTRAVADEHLIRREFYNPNDFDIVFHRDPSRVFYVRAACIPLGPEVAVLKAREWLVLPHAYYIPRATNGQDLFQLVQNFGDAIGKGNTKPSLPEMRIR